MLRRIISSRVTQVTITIAGLYWIIAAFFPTNILFEVLDGLVISLSAAVLVVYLPLTSEELLKHRLDRSGRLLLGIVLVWAATVLIQGANLLERTFGGSRSAATIGGGFILWTMIWAAVLHITAPGADAPQSSRRHWWHIAWALGFGGLLAGLAIGARLGFMLSKQ